MEEYLIYSFAQALPSALPVALIVAFVLRKSMAKAVVFGSLGGGSLPSLMVVSGIDASNSVIPGLIIGAIVGWLVALISNSKRFQG